MISAGHAPGPALSLPDGIGILGGMGPEATILLQSKLLTRVEARDDADHIPLLIDMNPQVPSRIAHLIDGTGPSPAPILEAMARPLASMGARRSRCPATPPMPVPMTSGALSTCPFWTWSTKAPGRSSGRGSPKGVLRGSLPQPRT
jgi:aspartate racemase